VVYLIITCIMPESVIYPVGYLSISHYDLWPYQSGLIAMKYSPSKHWNHSTIRNLGKTNAYRQCVILKMVLRTVLFSKPLKTCDDFWIRRNLICI
jgi:hypothetical protein